MAQMIKNRRAMQENQAQSLGWEDPLEKGMSTHSSILAWRIPWTEKPGRLQSMASQSWTPHFSLPTYIFCEDFFKVSSYNMLLSLGFFLL